MLKRYICHITKHVNRSTTHDYLDYARVRMQSQVVTVKKLVASIQNAVLQLENCSEIKNGTK